MTHPEKQPGNLPQRPDRARWLAECLEYKEFLDAESARNDTLIASLSGEDAAEPEPPEAAPPEEHPSERRSKRKGPRPKRRRRPLGGPTRAAAIDRVLKAKEGWLTIGDIIDGLRELGAPLDDDRKKADAAVRTVLKRDAARRGWETSRRNGTRRWRRAVSP